MLDLDLDGRISKEDDLYFLRKFAEYDPGAKDADFRFHYICEPLPGLDDYLPRELTRCEKHDFENMMRLMIWVHKALIPDSMATPAEPFHCLNILEKTRTDQMTSNCWMFSVVLNEIYLSLGYRSRMVRCMPLDLRFCDCHCVVQAYVEQYRKWVTFDPSFGTYYCNTQKVPLNLKEIREYIIRGEPILTPLLPMKYSKKLLPYWIKNSFRFESYAVSKFGAESDMDDALVYSLLPAGYELTDKTILYRNRKRQIQHTHKESEFWEE